MNTPLADSWRTLAPWVADHPGWAFAYAVFALLAVAIVVFPLFYAVRAVVTDRSRDRVEVGMGVVIGAANIVSATGMYSFMRDVFQLNVIFSVIGCGVLDVLMTFFAVLARRKATESPTEGDGRPGTALALMWFFTTAIAVLGASDASGAWAVVGRLIWPFLAASGWSYLLVLHRRQRGHAPTINWRLTPERIAIALRIADPVADRTASQAEKERRLSDLARAVRARDRAGEGAKRWLRRHPSKKAAKNVDKTMEQALTYASLATDPTAQKLLRAQLGILGAADTLTSRGVPSPWDDQPATRAERYVVDRTREDTATGTAAIRERLAKAVPGEEFTVPGNVGLLFPDVAPAEHARTVDEHFADAVDVLSGAFGSTKTEHRDQAHPTVRPAGPATASVPASLRPRAVTVAVPENSPLSSPETTAENHAESEGTEPPIRPLQEANAGPVSEPAKALSAFSRRSLADTDAEELVRELRIVRALFDQVAQDTGDPTAEPSVNAVAKAIGRRWERAKRLHDHASAERRAAPENGKELSVR